MKTRISFNLSLSKDIDIQVDEDLHVIFHDWESCNTIHLTPEAFKILCHLILEIAEGENNES